MKRFTILSLTILLILCSCAQTPANSADTDTQADTNTDTSTETSTETVGANPVSAEPETEPKRTAEPDPDTKSEKEIKYVLPEDVSAEMVTPSYWKASNAVLMTSEEIAEMNTKNEPFITYKDKSGARHSKKTKDIGGSFSGEELLDILDDFTLSVAAKSFVGSNKMSEDFVKSLNRNVNKSAVGDMVTPKFAICVKRAMIYFFPTDEPYYNEPNDFYYNENVMSETYAGDGVVVLHTSADGEWSFVLAEFFAGWIRNENLAICRDKAEWLKVIEPEHFLVVTGDKIVIDQVIPAPDTFEEIAYMGMKIKLSDSIKSKINGRTSFGAYCVELPSRDKNGNFRYVEATVAVTQDVSVGHLPISQKALIEQAYKFLGHTYGWGGTGGVNDCSGMAGQIWRCFGIKLPRNSGEINDVKGFKKHDLRGLDTNARIEIFKEIPQGSILFFRGHIMIYLGMKDGMPYCISSCGVYAPKGEKYKTHMSAVTANCVSINAMNILGGNRKTWLDTVETVISPCK